jgi:hypothetical protein
MQENIQKSYREGVNVDKIWYSHRNGLYLSHPSILGVKEWWSENWDIEMKRAEIKTLLRRYWSDVWLIFSLHEPIIVTDNFKTACQYVNQYLKHCGTFVIAQSSLKEAYANAAKLHISYNDGCCHKLESVLGLDKPLKETPETEKHKNYNELPVANKTQYKKMIKHLSDANHHFIVRCPWRFSDEQLEQIASIGFKIEVDNSTIDEYPHYPSIRYIKK